MNRAYALIVTGVLVLMAACKPGTPSQYIQPGDMEDILVDYYMARALAQQDKYSYQERDYNTAYYLEAVLKKHGVTQADFDSSLVYYYTRADRFDDIFERVSERLEEKALVLGASEGEIGKYASLNATGDTANLWADRNRALLLPVPPYNRWEFNIEADSTYRKGDAVMLMFMSDYMYQSGEKKGMVYMAVEYDDTVVSRNLSFSITGLSQMRIPEDTLRDIRAIKGFFYLGGANDPSATTRLLFLNNVQLIRFHTKPAEYEPTDSIPRDSIGGQLPPDTIGGRDTIGSSREVVPVAGGASKYRMDEGVDSVAP
ncbi:MAG: DUF4296 domain-containing protein [Prevotella sp.]|nr:DUF4296 domain-containing protein [Prevotella sp.]